MERSSNRDVSSYSKFKGNSLMSENSRSREFCCGLCCIQGCIIGSIGLVYFFLILPTGVLLIFHGVNHRYATTTLIGAAVLAVPMIVVPTIWMAIKWCRFKRSEKERYEQERRQHIDQPYTEPLRPDHGTDGARIV